MDAVSVFAVQNCHHLKSIFQSYRENGERRIVTDHNSAHHYLSPGTIESTNLFLLYAALSYSMDFIEM